MPERAGDGIRHLVGGGADGIGLEVGIPRGGLYLRMAQQPPDHGQVRAKLERVRGEGMAQIMDTQRVQPGPCAKPPPGFLDVGQILALHLPGDHIGIAVDPGNVRQHAQHPVGLIGCLFQPLVQFDDIGAGHVDVLGLPVQVSSRPQTECAPAHPALSQASRPCHKAA